MRESPVKLTGWWMVKLMTRAQTSSAIYTKAREYGEQPLLRLKKSVEADFTRRTGIRQALDIWHACRDKHRGGVGQASYSISGIFQSYSTSQHAFCRKNGLHTGLCTRLIGRTCISVGRISPYSLPSRRSNPCLIPASARQSLVTSPVSL